MTWTQTLRRPPWRTIVPGCGFLLLLLIAWSLWRPGLDLRDGRHDLGRNGIWLSHGWLGGDDWFVRYNKTDEIEGYRSPEKIRELAALLSQHHIPDLFPHLCPADPDGTLPTVDPKQVVHLPSPQPLREIRVGD